MSQSLQDYLKEHPCRGFNPHPYYVKDGDQLFHYFKNEFCVARQAGPHLTLYLEPGTTSIVGYKIAGLHELLAAAGLEIVSKPALIGESQP